MIEKFPCTGCGLCCRRIQNIKQFCSELSISKSIPDLEFPYEHNNGVCEKLIDNACSVYDSRPLICNIDKMQEVLGIEKSMFYNLNAIACNGFINEAGLDKSFLINL